MNVETDNTSTGTGAGAGPTPRKRQSRLRNVCARCREWHQSCEEARPCRRCVAAGVECVDARRQKRGPKFPLPLGKGEKRSFDETFGDAESCMAQVKALTETVQMLAENQAKLQKTISNMFVPPSAVPCIEAAAPAPAPMYTATTDLTFGSGSSTASGSKDGSGTDLVRRDAQTTITFRQRFNEQCAMYKGREAELRQTMFSRKNRHDAEPVLKGPIDEEQVLQFLEECKAHPDFDLDTNDLGASLFPVPICGLPLIDLDGERVNRVPAGFDPRKWVFVNGELLKVRATDGCTHDMLNTPIIPQILETSLSLLGDALRRLVDIVEQESPMVRQAYVDSLLAGLVTEVDDKPYDKTLMSLREIAGPNTTLGNMHKKLRVLLHVHRKPTRFPTAMFLVLRDLQNCCYVLLDSNSHIVADIPCCTWRTILE